MKKIVLILAALALPVLAHQYTSLDDLVIDVCGVHGFEKCSDPIVDSDGDSIPDDIDECPNDATNTCNDPIDTDGDGIPDDIDECPSDPANTCNDPVDPPAGHFLADSTVGVWVAIPDTKIRGVLPPESLVQPLRYLLGYRAITEAWNGAAWDEANQEAHIIAAGGHADYCGNEHLKFDLDDMAWTLVRGPSDLGGMTYEQIGEAGMTPDGVAASRHNYAGVELIPWLDKFILPPGHLCNPAGNGDNRLWLASRDGSMELVSDNFGGLHNHSMADPITQLVWVKQGGKTLTVDPATGVVDLKLDLINEYSSFSYKLGVAMSSVHRKIFFTGKGVFGVYDMETNTETLYSDRGDAFKNCGAPGVDYADSQGKFVVWCGGVELYWVDPVDWSVTSTISSGDAPAKTTNGIYGRFRWSDKYQGVFVIDKAYEDVRWLKL